MTETTAAPQPSAELATALAKLSVEQFVKVAEGLFPKVERQPSGMSPQIDQLAAALAIAQGEMFAPARNKHVTVTKKRGGTYDFRYASLDVIMDMIRLPLAQNGLAVMNLCRPGRSGQLFMATRLLHSSGQYMDSVLPLSASGFYSDDDASSHQQLGSAMTWCKRVNVSALLGIASQEDDDANVADGNIVIDHEYPVEPNAQIRVLQDRYARLVNAAANARDPAGVGEMMQRWQKGMEFWMRMRGDVDHAENFVQLMKLIPEAIGRVHHKVLGECFLLSATADHVEQINVVRTLWESTDAKSARAKMKELNRTSYGMLFEHLSMQAARVQREAEEAERRAAIEAQRVANELALEGEPSPFEGGRLVTPIAEELHSGGTLEEIDQAQGAGFDDDGLDQSYRQVRDEFGEIITDILNEENWAKCYVAAYRDCVNPVALRQHNADGLVWARRFVDAAAILMLGVGKDQWEPDAAQPAEPPPLLVEASPVASAEPVLIAADERVPFPAATEVLIDDARQLTLLPDALADSPVEAVALHKNGKGAPDLPRFLRAIKISLDQVNADDMAAWEDANLPTVDTLPKSTQLAIMGLIVGRKRVLGLDLALAS